jgi:hypothetical protein
VQLRLDLQYPVARRIGDGLQLIGIHQCPPGIPASRLRTCWLPSPCATAFPGSDYYGASAPPDGLRSATDPPTTRPAVWRPGRPRMVPTFTGSSIGQISAQLYPGSLATPTP